MKRILFILVCFLGVNVIKVYASDIFVEGDYISGEYVNKVINGKTYYMTMQYIRDNEGNIVYCLEPFTKFEENKKYNKIEGDLTGYKDLNNIQKRNIELLVYYGYGYGDRTSSKWYVITQYLIWKEVSPTANIYFTNKLNGTKIDKYKSEMELLLSDIKSHDIKPSFVKNYVVNYMDNLFINGLDDSYTIDTDFDYVIENGFEIYNLMSDGNITISKKSNYYDNKVVIYDSVDSQDLIRPGNVENIKYDMKIVVTKGDITLDIRDDKSVYSIESSLENTCYEILQNGIVIDKVCTSDDPLIYKTDYLSYGEYEVRQVSYGVGYKKDSNIYKVKIDDDNNNPKLVLYNKLIKNNVDIIKYACRNDVCVYEEGASFIIKDKDNNVVSEIVTDENGFATYVLGYGQYVVSQSVGLENYSISNSFSLKIVDEISEHKKILYNNYIEKEVIVNSPPDTGVDLAIWDAIINIILKIFALFGF